MICKKYTITTGFTLLETLVAILILMLSIAGPLTIAQRGLSVALVAKNQTVATYLAQDAMEYIRFVQDSNRLANRSWLVGLGVCTSDNSSKTCYVDSIQDKVNACSGSCPIVYYDDTNKWFSNVPTPVGSPSIFTRTVSITNPVGSNTSDAKVTVTVTWPRQGGGTSRYVTIQEDIFDWQ